jgi:ADP-ribose pyrophosphatase
MKKSDKLNGIKVGWKLLKTKYLWKSIWNRVRQDKIYVTREKKTLTYTYLEHDGAVFVVPVTSDKKIVLIKSYRWICDRWFWEIPAGIIADKKGKTLKAIARDEMFEEAGCVGGKISSLGTFYCANGILNLKTHFFLAQNVKYSATTQTEVGEVITERKLLSIEEVKLWMAKGLIDDADTYLALTLALNQLA